MEQIPEPEGLVAGGARAPKEETARSRGTVAASKEHELLHTC